MSASLATVSYIGATILFILCLGGLSNQETARRGNLFGTAAGVLLLIALLNLVVVLGLPIHWQYAVQGIVLVAATALQGFRQYLLSR